ncbi:hypothetical protein LguiA_032270 [Lonicera macranthoides]
MQHMEVKLATTITHPLLLCLFLLLVPACFSRGGMEIQNRNSEIYDIDYRGPETHSYLPPPNHGNPNNNIIHQQLPSMVHTKSKGMTRAANVKEKKVHG